MLTDIHFMCYNIINKSNKRRDKYEYRKGYEMFIEKIKNKKYEKIRISKIIKYS